MDELDFLEKMPVQLVALALRHVYCQFHELFD